MSGPSVDLILQPDAARSMSMTLYAQRLAAAAPEPGTWRVRRLPGTVRRPGRWLSELVLAPVALRLLHGDVAHVVDQAHAGYVHALAAPTLVTVHDLIPLKALSGEYGRIAGRMSHRAAWWYRHNIVALRAADRLVAPSAATAADAARLLGVHATVVPHGIDDVYRTPPPVSADDRIIGRLGALSSRPLIVSVSSGHFYKNDVGVATAFALLAAQRNDVALVRVGAPWPAAAAAVLASTQAHRHLHLGRIGAPELAALYRRAAVLAFVSWDEGFGWPPLEAMAAGLPVVASNRGALAETAAPAALVVDPGDHAAIAAAIARVIDEPALADELRARGAEHAARFRWENAIAAMASLYAETAACA